MQRITHFINAACLTRHHGGVPCVPKSRLLTFREASRDVRVQCYLHTNEFLPEGRKLQTSPIYDKLTARNAVWGDGYGLEAAMWFQKPGEEPVEERLLAPLTAA